MAQPTAVFAMGYGPNGFEELPLPGVADLDAFLSRPASVRWIDVRGVADRDLLSTIGERLGVHKLAVADLVNVPQRAKSEAYEHHTLTIAHMAAVTPSTLQIEQIGVVLGTDFVLTVQESEHNGDLLEAVRQRIRAPGTPIRTYAADYLAYALLDAIVDGWFPVIDHLSDQIEELEATVLQSPSRTTVRQIHMLSQTLRVVRRHTWPLREGISGLLRGDVVQLSAGTRVYLRDVHDHITHVVDSVDTYREFAASLMDLYLSTVNFRMNEIVKVLTIISTIFLPLSVVAGIYGMNFHTDVSPWNMPELGWFLGYPFALGLMALIAAGMLAGFWWKGWLGGKRADKAGQIL
jgi:magnesium transporter